MTNTIQSLWVGQRLSTLERLSIASHLYHGHPYHLYTYGSVSGIPAGVMVKDAGEILPRSEVEKFRCIANFSDYFRYNLLLKKGGWWCDTDTVCLRPFDLIDEHVFVQEHPYEHPIWINGGYLKAPANSPVMQWLVGQSQSTNWSEMSWADIGPALLTKALERFSLPSYPSAAFNPIPYKDWTIFIKGAAPNIHKDAFAVHLWHEMWRKTGQDPDARYPSKCLYEQLKKHYSVATVPGARGGSTVMARFAGGVRHLKRRFRSAMRM
jgi:Alpha 1,4-glycosyltransferase conserved region/Glycosyltransferase sugar-binding region containing DXD motif